MSAGQARPLDLSELLQSWELALRAERKSKNTITSYTVGVRLFLAWCQQQGLEPCLKRDIVRAWVGDILAAGQEAATVVTRQMAVRLFSAWLAEEGELDHDDLLGLKRPKLDKKVIERLSSEECRQLIAACNGRTFRDRRDEAIVRFMLDSPVRAGDVLGMDLVDVDPKRGEAIIRRGKGGKGRLASFGPQTGVSIDRYIRARRTHKYAATAALWLGAKGSARLGYSGLHAMLTMRANLAGISGFFPHKTRHTTASEWLKRGGSEQGLMTAAGWSSRAMLDRYTESTAAERAADEARRLNMGEW